MTETAEKDKKAWTNAELTRLVKFLLEQNKKLRKRISALEKDEYEEDMDDLLFGELKKKK